MSRTKTILNSAIVLYFIICLEILIMISPFAGFFYSAFNPLLLGLTKYPATKWLSSFFFTHMVVPPDDFLKGIRIMGSVLVALGLAVFLVCAVQVYASKFFRKGRPVLKGLYAWIRHPQYQPRDRRYGPRYPLAQISRRRPLARNDLRLLPARQG